jgi:hypothetical protein
MHCNQWVARSIVVAAVTVNQQATQEVGGVASAWLVKA